MAKRKKKKEELDASFMSGFLPGAASPVSVKTPALGNRIYSPHPFEVDIWRQRQLFNFPAYVIYGTILPSPLEQIAFIYDPLRIVPPYQWRGGFHAMLDVAATVTDPFGVARTYLHNPMELAIGRSDPNYWMSEEGMAMGDIFAQSSAAIQ